MCREYLALASEERNERGEGESCAEHDRRDEEDLFEASSGMECRTHIVRAAEGASVLCSRLLQEDAEDKEDRYDYLGVR